MKNITENERIALQKYANGEKPMWSSGIHEGYTCGYGEIDHNGYFEFPLYDLAKQADIDFEKKYGKKSFSPPPIKS